MRNAAARRSIVVAVAVLTLLGAGYAGAQTVLFEDNFEEPDGSRPQPSRWILTGKQDGAFWTYTRGMLSTGPGDQYPIGPTTAVANAPGAFQWTNYTVSTRFTFLDTDGNGEVMLVARANGGNMYIASFAVESGKRSVRIKKSQNGVEAEMAAAVDGQNGVSLPAFDRAGAGPFLAQLQVKGDEITVFLEGKRVLSWRDTRNPFLVGSAGVGQFLSSAVFSDFKVTDGAASGSGTDASQGAAASGGGKSFRISTITGLDRADAEKTAQQYRDDGQRDVAIFPDSEGFTVYIGNFPTRAEAEKFFQKLENDGVIVNAVEEVDPQALQGPATGGAPRNIRVELGRLRDEASARQLRQRAALVDSIYPVDIRQEGNDWVVYALRPVAEMAEGQRRAAEMQGRGYPDARAVRVEAAEVAVEAPTSAQIDAAIKDLGVSAPASDMDKVRELVAQQLEANAREGLTPAQRRQIEQLNERQRQLLETTVKAIEFNQQLDAMRAEARNFINARKFDEARRTIAELREMKSSDASIPILEDLLRERESRGTAADAEARAGRIAQLADEAKKAESEAMAEQDLNRREQKLQRADDLWTQVQQQTDKQGERRIAGERLAAIRTAMSDIRQARAEAEKARQSNRLMLIIAAVAAGIAVAGGAFFVMLRKQGKGAAPSTKPSAKAPAPALGSTLAAIPAAASVPTPNVFGAAPASGTAAPTPLPARTAKQQAPPEEPSSVNLPGFGAAATPLPTVGADEDRIRPGVMVPAATPEGISISAERTPSSAAIPLAGAAPIPETASVHEQPTGMVQIAGIAPVPSSASVEVPSRAAFQTPLPVSQPNANAVGMGFLFEQGFDDEAVGQPPRGWKGQYDYATLAVVPRDPKNPGAGNCMRFEKKTGAGAAYYALKFPDASGRIAMEFDLRCDDKNRYLIGFYIEKDEDFRQAISTIVHRPSTTAPPTLRLQGESHPYEFGRWVRVRFIIDLPRNLVDGWVDDISVAAGVRLNQAPKVLNTLSIRDNSATTGVLMVDNIRIYRAP
jgi:hypothetical protein